MQLSHTRPVASAMFDDPNLVSCAGLVPIVELAQQCGLACGDIDDTIVEVHGHDKQGSGYGYSGVRGLNALITTLTTELAAPVIAGQRLRKGACGSGRGAARMVADTLATLKRLRGTEPAGKASQGKVLLRA